MNHKKLILYAIPFLAMLSAAIYMTKTFSSIGVFVFDFSTSFLIVFIALSFVRKEIFSVWLKFMMIFVPLSTIFILLVPEVSSDLFFPIEKKILAFSLAVVLVVVSFLIIIFKSIQLRKEDNIRASI